jgi:hypothetical protein
LVATWWRATTTIAADARSAETPMAVTMIGMADRRSAGDGAATLRT